MASQHDLFAVSIVWKEWYMFTGGSNGLGWLLDRHAGTTKFEPIPRGPIATRKGRHFPSSPLPRCLAKPRVVQSTRQERQYYSRIFLMLFSGS
ncbi:hypothetical protein N7501_003294 [Penicillium viridicatum]|nr:hypothetical protein N7501_003294 [Penicillium viridicatum]